MTRWTVNARPVEDPHGDTLVRGLAVSLELEDEQHEIGRVAFVREHSTHPDVTFEQKMDEVLDRAERVCDVLNAALDDFDQAREEELLRSRDRIAELVAPLQDTQQRGML